MSNTLIGAIHSIGETKQVTEKFSKREFVIMINDNNGYQDYIQFELQQGRCDLIDPYQLNQVVEVSYNLKGRQWTDKDNQVRTFNTIVAWKIQLINNF